MNTFLTRQAAWQAMMIADSLRHLDLSHVQLLRDGSVRFRYHDVPYEVGSDFVPKIVAKAQAQVVAQDEVHITGNAEQFASRGDVWNASNYQHHAGNPDASVRQNDFGDVCHKPDIEGYDPEAYTNSVAARLVQAKALKAVVDQAKLATGDKNRDKSRELFNARRAFLRAKS